MITLTDPARTKIQKLVQTKGYAGIRLGVKTTGCSGLAYVLEYVKAYEPDDSTINYAQNEFCVIVDKKHDVYLQGTQVDKASMKVLNLPTPMNATAVVAEKVLESNEEFLGT